MSESAQKILQNNMSAVSNLVEAYPHSIPVLAVAEMLHIKPEGLRASIEQGRCPFGFCWKLGDRMAYKVPTMAFCSWMMGRTP